MEKIFLKTGFLSAAILVLSIPFICMAQNDFGDKIEELYSRLVFAEAGSVLSVEKDIIYIDLGQRDWIITGTRFDVVRQGEALIVDGKIIGHKETIIGEAEVERVRENISIARMTHKAGDIIKGDKIYRQKKKIKKIVVTEFEHEYTTNKFAKNIREMMDSYMSQAGIQVVESKKIEEILKWNKLALTDLSCNNELSNMGRLLDVDAVMAGSISDMKNALIIKARLIDVEKKMVISSADVKIDKTDVTAELINEPVVDKKIKSESSTQEKGCFEVFGLSFTMAKKMRKVYDTDDLIVFLKAFKKTKDSISMTLIYDNQSNKDIIVEILAGADNCLVDENGEKWKFKEDTTGIYKNGKEVMARTRLATDATFIPAGSLSGADFTLFMSHCRPYGFQIVANNLIAE